MIKKLLKYGTVAAVSFELGTIVQTHYLNHKAKGDKPDDYRDYIWEGESAQLKMKVDEADKLSDALTDAIDRDEHYGAMFREEDLRDVRAKLAHGVSEAKEVDDDIVIIEVNDRQRLRFIDEVLLHNGNQTFRPKSY